MSRVPDAAGQARTGRHRFALWARAGLGMRVFIGILAIIVLEALVFAAVASWVGPQRFADLVEQQGNGGRTLESVRSAFLASLGVALAIGLVVAVIGGAAAAWFIAGRLSRPLDEFASVARQVSGGNYAARVPRSGLGPEFDDVEAAFNDMTRRLESTEEVRGQLIADLSHEMRTPLMTLTTYLEALEDGVRPPLATTWEVMSDQVRRLSRLASDMSTAAVDQEGVLTIDRAMCDLSALVAMVVRGAREGPLGSVLRIEGRVPAVPVPALVDSARIEQVLTNLIDNACRHAKGASWVEVTVQPAAPGVRITVEDDGCGVLAEDRGRVFDRFYRADRSRTGTGAGLGLAISRSIIRSHGGQLTYEDRPGGGARFVIALPGASPPD